MEKDIKCKVPSEDTNRHHPYLRRHDRGTDWRCQKKTWSASRYLPRRYPSTSTRRGGWGTYGARTRLWGYGGKKFFVHVHIINQGAETVKDIYNYVIIEPPWTAGTHGVIHFLLIITHKEEDVIIKGNRTSCLNTEGGSNQLCCPWRVYTWWLWWFTTNSRTEGLSVKPEQSK